MMLQVAFLGTGLLGAAMVERAAPFCSSLVAWNRTAAKAQALEALGVQIAPSPAEAVRGADRVHLVLRDDAAVDEVLHACGAELRGKLVIDHSTVTPAGVLARAATLQAQGIDFLHAPVFMGPAAARTAGGSMYVSGPTAAWHRGQAALTNMTARVVYLGERPDLAAVYKLVGNAMIITINAGLADALAVAKAAGVSPLEAMPLFDVFDPCGTIAGRGAAMAAGDYRTAFALDMAHKDVALMLETARQGHESLHLLPAIAQRMHALIADGHGARDLAALAVDSIPPRD